MLSVLHFMDEWQSEGGGVAAEDHEGRTGIAQKSLKWGKRLPSVLHFMDDLVSEGFDRSAARGTNRRHAEVLEVG